MAQSYPQGESSKPNPAADRQIKHFANIARDAHRDAHPRRFPEGTATQIEPESLNQITGVDFLGNVAVFEEMSKPFWKKAFSQFRKDEAEEKAKQQIPE